MSFVFDPDVKVKRVNVFSFFIFCPRHLAGFFFALVRGNSKKRKTDAGSRRFQ